MSQKTTTKVKKSFALFARANDFFFKSNKITMMSKLIANFSLRGSFFYEQTLPFELFNNAKMENRLIL